MTDSGKKFIRSSRSTCHCLCTATEYVCALTADSRGSPLYCDTVLTTFVCVCSNAGAQALTIPSTIAVACVSQAVFIKPGYIHLGVHRGLDTSVTTGQSSNMGQDTECPLTLTFTPIIITSITNNP